MPQLQLTNDELTLMITGIETTISSAQRAQKQAKSAAIADAHKVHETNLAELRTKLIRAHSAKQ